MIDFSTTETKNELISRLKVENLLVTFTKVDGSERSMLCTLRQQFLPAVETKSTRTPSTETCSVFDLKSGGWRSFRWDSVTSVESQPLYG